MKKQLLQFLLLTELIGLYPAAFAQKPVIDSSVYGHWASVEGARISNDGNYVTYTIHNQPSGSATTMIRSLKTGRIMALPGKINGEFTSSSQQFLYSNNDSLFTVNLPDLRQSYIGKAGHFQLVKTGNAQELLLYFNSAGLVIHNLVTNADKDYSCQAYRLSPDTRHVLIISKIGGGQQLQILGLEKNELQTIYEGQTVSDIVFSSNGTELALLVSGSPDRSIWLCQAGKGKAEKVVGEQQFELDPNLEPTGLSAISDDGKRLLVNLQRKQDKPVKNPKLVAVDVYSYKDPVLQSEQLQEGDIPVQYKALYELAKKHLTMLENKGLKLLTPVEDIAGKNLQEVLVQKTLHPVGSFTGVHYGGGEWNWNRYARYSIELLDVRDGSLRPISGSLEDVTLITLCELSLDGRYVLWYDASTRNFRSYCITTGIERNVTATLQTDWTRLDMLDNPAGYRFAMEIAGYTKDNSAVLLYDHYDIYRVDLSGAKAPFCLTNQYGKQHNISFRIVMDKTHARIFDGEHILLSAFNNETKEDGYYQIKVGQQKDPERLTIGPYIYNGPEYGNEATDGSKPIKAKEANVYMVKRQSASESPNYFVTSDFRTFMPVSDVYPEKRYNWMTTELVTFRTLDGGTSQGILYKPENFDPNKKYPLIITYYEIGSNGLNGYIEPVPAGGPIQIPLYVSNGYLIFFPDIHFTMGSPGRSSYNTVVAAAESLANRPYVDGKHMGIQGHSFGGFQTNYIVTHTPIFAAAMASSGMTDFVSIYNSLPNGHSRQGQYENFRDRMGGTLWDMPDKYIENSPVLLADQITTPLLMMANKSDGDVPYYQGIEFFTGLRRLGKKAWLLQYDKGGHFAPGGSGELDLTTRMKQFFDYYLKDAPAPSWMTRGIPAKLKQVDSGLETDTSGATP